MKLLSFQPYATIKSRFFLSGFAFMTLIKNIQNSTLKILKKEK